MFIFQKIHKMGILDGLFQQINAIRQIGNKNVNNLQDESSAEYSGDDDEVSALESEAESEDLESPENVRAVRRLYRDLKQQNSFIPKSNFTKEELDDYAKILTAIEDGDNTPLNRALLEKYQQRASVIFAMNGGRSFVESVFKRCLLRIVFNDSEVNLFEKYIKKALGNPEHLRDDHTLSDKDDSVVFQYDTEDDISQFSPDVDGQLLVEESTRKDTEFESTSEEDLKELKRKLPYKWDDLSKWQQYAWLVDTQNAITPWRIVKRIMNLQDTSENEFKKKIIKFKMDRDEAFKKIMKESRKEMKKEYDANMNVIKNVPVVRFRMGMTYENKATDEGKFRLVSVAHNPKNPYEVIFEHKLTGVDSDRRRTWWRGELQKSLVLNETFAYQYIVFRKGSSTAGDVEMPISLNVTSQEGEVLKATDENFDAVCRFVPGMKYFCPKWEDGRITDVRWFVVKNVEENSYVVFEDSNTKEEMSLLIERDVMNNDLRTTYNVNVPDGMIVEYAMTEEDDVDDMDCIIYSTYTKRKFKIIDYEMKVRARGDAMNEAAMARNAARQTNNEPEEDTARDRAPLIGSIVDNSQSAAELPNFTTTLNEDKVLELGHLQRVAYFKSRRKKSMKSLVRFRIGEEIPGKKSGGVARVMYITSRGTKMNSDDTQEYLNVTVTDKQGIRLGSYEYRIKMHAKGFPFYRANGDFAFEVAALTSQKNANVPQTISAWRQSCPVGFEKGVEYHTDVEVGILFTCGDRLDNQLKLVNVRWVKERENVESLLRETTKSIIYKNTRKHKPYNEALLNSKTARKTFGESFADFPTTVEEYEEFNRRRSRNTTRRSKQKAATLSRTNKKFSAEEFSSYKDLVLREGQAEVLLSESENAQLNIFRLRAQKLLSNVNVFLLKNDVESKFHKRQADMDEEDWSDYQSDLRAFIDETNQLNSDGTSTGTSEDESEQTLTNETKEEVDQILNPNGQVNQFVEDIADY